MRKLAASTLTLVAALSAGAAHADCAVSDPLTCDGTIRDVVNDPVSRDVFFRMNSADEANLVGCTPSGPAVVGNAALRLARSSTVFQENYQLVLLATASTLSVSVKLQAGPGGICDVETIVLDSVF